MRKKLATITIIGTGIIAAFLAVVWWLFASGRLVYIDLSSIQKSYSVACDSSMVDRYNNAIEYRIRDKATLTMDEAGLSSIKSDILAKSDYDKDPTCQTMIFWTAVHDDDYVKAISAYNSLKDMHEKRVFADSNIRGNQPLLMYSLFYKDLTGSNNSNVNSPSN